MKNVVCHWTKKMSSDNYLNNPEEVHELEDMGCDVEAVDLNKNFVPTDKFKSDNLEKTNENIKDNFSL